MAEHSIKEEYLGRGKGWQYTYQVRGGWPFPVDMLRYDEAIPATDLDKATIDRLSLENAATLADLRPQHNINLIGTRYPTKRRWQSFLWRVI